MKWDERGTLFAAFLLALALWWAIFVLRPAPFWWLLTGATSLLGTLAVVCGRPLFAPGERWWRSVALGAVSAVVLYSVFWIGKFLLFTGAHLFPSFFPDSSTWIASVYADRGAMPSAVLALLLAFPIGCGEELFWRGWFQRRAMSRFGRLSGLVATTLAYTLIHVPTGNPVLLIAALVCGCFWGGLYAWTGSLAVVMVSHLLWDPLIFVLLPLSS